MDYKRVTEEERTLICRWGQAGQSQSETALHPTLEPCLRMTVFLDSPRLARHSTPI